jgi:hypothetical protein
LYAAIVPKSMRPASEKKVVAMTRMAMTAEVTGWAATADRERFDVTGGWDMFPLPP